MQAKRYVQGYRSLKNISAIDCYTNGLLEPSDPLYGWGVLAHHNPREVLEPPGFELIIEDAIAPTAFTAILRALLTGEEVETTFPANTLRVARHRALHNPMLPVDLVPLFEIAYFVPTETGAIVKRSAPIQTTRPY